MERKIQYTGDHLGGKTRGKNKKKGRYGANHGPFRQFKTF